MRESRIHLNQRPGNKLVISRIITLIIAGLILPVGSLTFSGCGKKEQADKGMKEAVAEEMAKPIQHRRMMPDDMTLDEIIKQLKKYTPVENVSVRENSTFYRYSVGLLEHYMLLCAGLETIEDYTYLKAIEWIARNRGPAALPRERYIKSLIHLGAEFSTRSPWETKTIKLLLKDFKKRPDLYPKDFINLFLFDIAKASCEEDGGELILKAGANINAKDADGMTALMHAANFARDKVTKLLLKHGADVNAKDKSGNTALMFAADHQEDDVVRLLLEYGADVNAKDKSGNTALMFAADHQEDDVARLLLEYGADVNAKDKFGNTALMFAAAHQEDDVARLLLEHGADVNAKDKSGNTALMFAADHQEDDVARLLLEHGADINAKDKSGNTALMFAAGQEEQYITIENDKVVRLLLEHGAEVDAKNESGETALMVAASNGYEKNVTLLLEHGADADLRNADGKTARELAARESITNLLMRHEKKD